MSAIFPSKMTLRPEFVWNESFWTPAQLSTALWLDAADSSTITLNGSTVSQWDDKSGNARNATQATAANQPTYTSAAINGKNVVTFDGTNDILGFTSLAFTNNIAGLTYLLVAKTADQATTSYKAMFQVRASTVFDRAAIYVRNSQIEAGGRRLDSDSYQMQSVGAVTTDPFIGSAVYNYASANLAVNLNGGTVTSGTFQTAGNTSATNSVATSIGSSNAGGDSFTAIANQAFNGQVAELIVIASAIDTTTRQKFEGYLAWKWGLVANLPSDHPYKINPPLR